MESLSTVSRGRDAESFLARYLQNQGFEILARNWRTPHGEVDLVVTQGETLICIEVKSRSSCYFKKTQQFERAISWRQKQRLKNACTWIFVQKKKEYRYFKTLLFLIGVEKDKFRILKTFTLPLLYDNA